MKIKNIDNEYLLTHRYGWHKIMYILQKNIHINKDIIIIDFMDKYFNLWFELPKIITFKNTIFNLKNADSYYRINDVDKADIYITEINNEKIYLRWYKEYDEFKELYNENILNLKKKYNIDIIDKSWIGFLHYPEFTEEMNYTSYESLPNILQSNTLQKSLQYCKGIVVLSDHLKKYLIKYLNLYNLSIPVKTIYHPTNFDCIKFDYNNFIKNNDKKIIQLGFWMRNMKTIFDLKNNNIFKKFWLPGGKYWKEMFYKMYDDADNILKNESVTIKMYLSNEEYDEIISSNVCLVNVYNSSANNSILECIAANIPLFVNKHPAVIEYLGDNYPLYYTDINNLNNIIEDNELMNKILNAYNYLKNLNKNKFKIEFFCNKFKEFVDELNI